MDEDGEENQTNDNTICPICEGGFDKDDSCIYCGCCRRWFHAACQNITEEEITAFRILKKLAHYFCPQCSAGASELYTAQVICKERVDRLEKKVEEINVDTDKLKTDVDNLKNQQSKNKSAIKTLETVHATLRKETDDANTNLKDLKHKEKSLREEQEKLSAATNSNTIKINAASTRLDKISDDMIGRMNSIIDDRVEIKFKQLKNEMQAQTPIDETMIENTVAKTVQEKVDKLHNEDSLKQKIDNQIKEKVENFSIDYNPFVQSSDMETDSATNKTQIVSRVFTSAVNNVVSEREEIERRKLQVVITGLQENNNNEQDERDAKEIFTLMSCNINIVESIRVGKVKSTRPRPLRITVENLTDKRTLLAKATALRKVPSTHRLANVYVKPNLTIRQQEDSKNLNVELKEIRLKNPEKKFKITKGQIVELPQNN